MLLFILRVNDNPLKIKLHYNVGGQRRQGLFGGPKTVFKLRPVRGD